MKAEDLLRMVEILHRDLGIPTESLFQAIEERVTLAVQVRELARGDVEVAIDRSSGVVTVRAGGREIEQEDVVERACKSAFLEIARDARRRRDGPG